MAPPFRVVSGGRSRVCIMRRAFTEPGLMPLFPRVLSILALALVSSLAQATSVLFLNPGFSNERFWVAYSDYMEDAAGDLGMRLEVLYGERDIANILRHAHEVLQRPHKPDYLIFVNEHT